MPQERAEKTEPLEQLDQSDPSERLAQQERPVPSVLPAIQVPKEQAGLEAKPVIQELTETKD